MARFAAYTLPVTHGIQLLQDIMLRGDGHLALFGGIYGIWQFWALGAVGVVLFLVTSLTLKRALAHPI
jgi:hypothetical protein